MKHELIPITVESEYCAVPLSLKKTDPQRVYALVSIEDAERTMQKRWSRQSKGYGSSSEKQPDGSYKSVLMHRWMIEAPSGQLVDHANGDRLDNRRSNLRIVDARFNARHRPNADEPLRGAHRDRRFNWVASARNGSKQVKRHGFRTQQAAAAEAQRMRDEFGYPGS